MHPVETMTMTMTDILLHVIAAVLILTGLVGALVPALPGIPLMFGGLWLTAELDRFRHLGRWWLLGIALIGGIGMLLDMIAGAWGAKRVGASHRAVWGALLGSIVGLLFGIPGLLFGPFCGALLGELSSGGSVSRSARVGIGAWLGLLFGTLVKVVCSVTMLALFAAGWWWNRGL